MKEKIELTGVERALLVLARHIDRCPYNEYKVEEQVLEELGYMKKSRDEAA